MKSTALGIFRCLGPKVKKQELRTHDLRDRLPQNITAIYRCQHIADLPKRNASLSCKAALNAFLVYKSPLLPSFRGFE